MSKVVEPATGREQTGEVWSTQIKLPDNVDQVYRYKFIVDGDWVYDSSQPTVANDHGSFDNYIVVSITKLNPSQTKLLVVFHRKYAPRVNVVVICSLLLHFYYDFK